jgi:hypothetical protein
MKTLKFNNYKIIIIFIIIMMDINFITNSIIGLFLLYLIILANFAGSLLNCRIQELFTKVALAKHFVIFFTIYYFINITNTDTHNPVHTLYKTAFMHLIFIISKNIPILYSVIILLLMFIIKFLEDYKNFHYQKNNYKYKLINKIQIGLSIIIGIILIVGFIQYTKFEYKKHKKNWNWKKYIIGVNKNKSCDSLADKNTLGSKLSIPTISNMKKLYK